MGGEVGLRVEARAAGVKEKRGATLLRDLHSCSQLIIVT